jgi:predicted O-methyltransferase YrrM
VTLRRRAYNTLLDTVRRARIAPQNFSDWRVLRELAGWSLVGARLVSCFERLDEPSSAGSTGIHAIEQERQRMLKDPRPLIDGSEGKPGLYDEGQTIAAAAKVSKSPRSALLLYHLVREFKPQLVVELGTNVGISAAYQAMALSKNRNGGRLVTFEASPYRLRHARVLHATLGLANVSYIQGLFSDTLPSALAELGHVELAYIDGHHQYQPTLDYFEALWQHSRDGAMFVFDDIRWSSGMLNAWTELRTDPRLGLTADLGSMGIGFRTERNSRTPLPAVYSVLHPGDPSARARFEQRALRVG